MSNIYKYKRVRLRLLLLPFFSLFSLYLLFKFLLPDYLIKQKDLDTDKAIIQNVFKNKYASYEKFKGKVFNSCIDVVLVGKPYFIRLSDHAEKKYWPLINDPANISKQIEVKFQGRLLHDNILENPNQISINNKVIIPYNHDHTFIGWFALAMTFALLICLYFTYSSFKTYKVNLYVHDKKIWQKSKWQLCLVWLTD